MKKLMVLFTLTCSFVLSANDKADYVQVTLNHDKTSGEVTLDCVPLLTMENMPNRWVKICNEQGVKVLKEFSNKGQAVKITNQPFGMAGEFMEKASQDLPKNVKPTKITSVDLSIR